jgi:polyphenol oxidase
VKQQPVPSPKSQSDRDLKAIDAIFNTAGLVRNRRGTPAGITTELRRVRLERVSKEELSVEAPAPRLAANGVELLQVAEWQKKGRARIHWLWHGFSTRRGGVSRAYCAEDSPGELNLGYTASDARDAVLQNRRLLAEAVTGTPETPLVTLRQIHSNHTVISHVGDSSRETPRKGDGLVTSEPGLLLGIQTADCVPVLIADRRLRAVGAFHAGWRGTVKRIVETGVGRMRLEFGSRPEDLVAAIGPCVGACCYSVGDEVRTSFESQFAYARELFHDVFDSDPVRTKYPMLFLTQRAPGHSPIGPSLHLDLVEANRRQLLDSGVKAGAIHVVGGCTSCQTELFFSHRASGGHAGRMMSVIGIKG